jgi:putative NADH-flavin reductase
VPGAGSAEALRSLLCWFHAIPHEASTLPSQAPLWGVVRSPSLSYTPESSISFFLTRAAIDPHFLESTLVRRPQLAGIERTSSGFPRTLSALFASKRLVRTMASAAAHGSGPAASKSEGAPAAERVVAIVGSTGRTGAPAVDLIRERDGFRVIAIGRSMEKLEKLHGGKKGVELRTGDVSSPASIRDAIAGATDVITATGYMLGEGSPPPYMATAMSVTDAMRHHGIRNLVFMGSSAVVQPGDKPTCYLNTMLFVARYIACMGKVLDDQNGALERVLKARTDDIDWKYVRPGDLTDGPMTDRPFQVGYMGEIDVKPISRSDVARFLVDQVTDDTYVHQAQCMTLG